jgi:iron-sulfur cluster assembly accessory protein
VKFTEKALNYIKSIQPQDQLLRVKVVGGGCSGLSYAMEFTKDHSELDEMLSQDGLVWVVDKKSWLFLNQVEIDWTDGLTGTGFTYTNPIVKRSCGCGTSFST